jgi:Rrf2 family protein
VELTLSRTADYAVRAAIALAEAWGDGYRTIREVATEMELPPSFTPQVLGLLARGGIAESKAGRGGGYRLTRPPRRISMLEVVEAAEGPLANERCTLRGGPCRWDDHCAVHETWTRAREALRRQLARSSLADVAAEDRRTEGR